jgi:Protein kinase domain
MTPQRHQQIKQLFLAAVELAPSQAQQFLDCACGDDHELRSEVQSLLDHHRTETLLEAANAAETAGPPDTTLVSSYQGEQPTAEPGPARPAGTMIAGRYRLVAPIGRGGMGVVFRAEDTELSQTIALKFLSPALQQRPDAVEFLRREVRIARQITHPNVVRIFDLDAADGEMFISMEFVAGEDLASLVRRVGPLPAAKVMQIARQLAAGLAAAHDAGILHRDLKPGNVMIDGAGNVRILDFGIATPVDDERALRRPSGTPGFLAPELLKGHKPTQRSDLYAWGVVVYYAATGKLPDVAKPTDQTADNPLDSARLDSELAACIWSCLETDPARRPQSTHDLVAALSTVDPLREALEAGRVPSPEQVTSATSWQPSNGRLDLLMMAGLVLLALIVLLADRTLFLSRCGLVKSPVVLQEIAAQALVSLGHPVPEGPVLTGVILDTNCLQYVRDDRELNDPWPKVSAGEIPAVSFWYRQGDRRLPAPALLGESDSVRLTQALPGTTTVRLDGRGKLLSLRAPLASPNEQAAPSTVSWKKLFELAGLAWSEFQETTAYRLPTVFADEAHAWEGPFPANPTQHVKVTAAALGGRVVFFEVDPPWQSLRSRNATVEPTRQSELFIALRTTLWLVATCVAAVLAWRHVRQGHADWRGAWRVTACVLVLVALAWLSGSRHTFVAAAELSAALLWLNVIVSCGAVAGMAYLAVEPSARRWWPWSIITMRRVLSGRLMDHGVWTDALLGMVVGLGSLVMRQLDTLTNQLLGVRVSGLNEFDPSQNLLDNFGLRYRIAVFITALLLAVLESLLLLTIVVALKKLTRSTLVAAVVLVLLFASLSIFGRGIVSPIDWLARTLLWSIAAWLLLRYGLLATIAALTTFYAVNNAPISLDWSRWYAVTGFFVVTTVAAALVVCWRLARSR